MHGMHGHLSNQVSTLDSMQMHPVTLLPPQFGWQQSQRAGVGVQRFSDAGMPPRVAQ